MLLKRIAAVDFSVLNPDMIRKMSALEVKSADTYDKDGYPMEAGLMDPHLGVINPGLRCKTCGQKMKTCPGHFGVIELVRPVLHSQFSKKVEELLQATCKECGRVMLPDEKIKELQEHVKKTGADLTKYVISKTRAAKKCQHCNAQKLQMLWDSPTNFFYNKLRIYPTQIREWIEKIPEEELTLFGYSLERIRPEWFVLTVLPVPPITIRPSITLETGIKSEDDLTHKLVDIIRINQRLKDNIDAGAPQLIIEDLWDLLQYHVTTYFDNNTAGVPPAKHRSGRALRTLVQRLKGKRGRFRYNLTGKRVNFAARSIITPDPYISINELGVPESIAQELTVPEFVTKWNIEEIKKLVKETDKAAYLVRPNESRKRITPENRAEVVKEIEQGFRIERQVMDGDIVLFNRQPSLHRLSMLAHKAKIVPYRTFRINPIVCKPYNADFDGDEMNMHVPQTEEGKTEAKQLMYVQNQIISPRYGAPVIILDEDGVSGTFVLTLKSTKFPREEAMRILYDAGIDEIPSPDLGKEYSGKLIFSTLLPKNLNIEFRTKTCKALQATKKCEKCVKDRCEYDSYLKIKNGKLVCGVVDAAALGEGKGKLVDALAREYPSDVIAEFYKKLLRIAVTLITMKGMTVGIDEYETSEATVKVKEDSIKKEMEEAEALVEKFRDKTLEHIPGRTLEESFEINMLRLGARTKDAVEKHIMKERIENILSEKPKLNTIVMVVSGARGSATNLTNVSGFWGQANVREGRPRRGFKGRLIALNEKNDVGALAGGFISRNFVEGMDAKQYFYHSMGGRQGEVDTGVSTKVSGYLYRRLANALKDLVVNNDLTVRTANKNIIQYSYGEDGVFPMHTIKGMPISIKRAHELGKKE
ncbi:MAG: DNA-directed RNA polymerase subunit A' [Candidatus Diapherotrites archaeon]|uniref:DNA-directed RNA polymerase subunit n=1 Tax=Candidatus Iainarchaeum sp. TaxID=3101447 RepID=A0A8T4KSK6_9ARCH|nr:DNA-directed RNA polymerase subunit A' [Candidatus Diapherotrites archaeon]